MDINFHYQVPVNIKFKSALTNTAKSIFFKEKQKADSLSVVFCSDNYLLNINLEYLQHDTYTDIISFNYAPKNEPVNGELYISMDRVRENARLFHTTVEEERARVIFHGVLHFCGYKDKTTKEVKLMRSKEVAYLKMYNRLKS